MSIIYCEQHDRRWDSDFFENCPLCIVDDFEFEAPRIRNGWFRGLVSGLLRGRLIYWTRLKIGYLLAWYRGQPKP